jgi:hypothetical protein
LLDLWAQAISAQDPAHLLLLGGQKDFRSLATVSDSYNGMLPLAYRPSASAQGGFNGIEAIDIARRANHFLAFAFADARVLSGALLYDWAGQAFVHGAAGFGLDGWGKIKGDMELQKTLLRLRTLSAAGAFPRTPLADTAFLYEPLAGGPLYGFMSQAASAEPGILFYEFGRGTRFGLVDYLTEDMLTAADLARYGVVFAPLGFSASAESQQALIAYVNGGGIVVADWGIGVYQSGGLNSLPDNLSALFSVGFIYADMRAPLNISVLSPDPLFPSLPFEAVTTGSLEGAAFSGLMGNAFAMPPEAIILMTIMYDSYTPSIILHHVGNGAAIFASMPLWENWR